MHLLRVAIPPPFDMLNFVADKRRKGRRILACLEDCNKQLQVYLAPSGVAIVDNSSYFNGDGDTTSMLFMQCTYYEYSSRGYVFVARYTHDTTGKCRKLIKNSDSGFVEDCFLCIVQGYCSVASVISIVFHTVDPDSPSLMQVIESTSSNWQDFGSQLFTKSKTLCNHPPKSRYFL